MNMYQVPGLLVRGRDKNNKRMNNRSSEMVLKTMQKETKQVYFITNDENLEVNKQFTYLQKLCKVKKPF